MTTTEPLPQPAAPTTAPAPARRNRRYNWPRIKADYVEGIVGDDGKITWPTYEVVAARNNALPQNVRTRAAHEHWTAERAAFQHRLDQQRQEERTTELASLGADLDIAALRVAKNGLSITAARIQELGLIAQRRAEHLRQNGGTATAGAPRAVNSDELGVLARAAAQWHDLGRRALGDTPLVRVEHHGQVDIDVDVDATVRDEKSLTVLAILAEAKVLPDGVVDTRDVLDVAGTGALGDGHEPDAEDEPVHAAELGDTG